jgi:hypothetical protein
MFCNPHLQLLATLKLLYLLRLTNNPIKNQPHCPVIPTKLPLDLPKFDGKFGEYPSTHVMSERSLLG